MSDDDIGPFDRSIDWVAVAMIILICSAFWFVAGVFAGKLFL